MLAPRYTYDEGNAEVCHGVGDSSAANDDIASEHEGFELGAGTTMLSMAQRRDLIVSRKDVDVKFRNLMRGPVRRSFQKAASGQLYHPRESARVKLPCLENELKRAMSGAVKDQLIDKVGEI